MILVYKEAIMITNRLDIDKYLCLRKRMNNYNRTSRTLLDFTSEMCNFPYNDFKKDSNFKEISLIKKEYVVKKFEDKYTRLLAARIHFLAYIRTKGI